MVKKLGKRKRKALAKAKRQKGIKEKFPTNDIITKLLYIGQELRDIAKEMGYDEMILAEEGEEGEYWTPDALEKSGLTTEERINLRIIKNTTGKKNNRPAGSFLRNEERLYF